MGQSKSTFHGPRVYHVNFHTMRNRRVFEVPEYQSFVESRLTEVLERWSIPCLAWQIMPTHVHLVLITFPDQPLARALNLIKGYTARHVLLDAPELRADLGDHLWQEGYDWVEVTSHRQCANAVRYVRENRQLAGLEE